MTFSATLPSTPGYYWVKNDANPTPVIVSVSQQTVGNGTGNLSSYLWVNNWSINGTEQWEGPLIPST